MLDSNRTLVQPVIHCNIINRPVQCTENGISSLWCPSQWCMCWWCLVAQSCPTLCDPIDCSPPSSSVHGDSPGTNTGVSCHALLQGIFRTQGLNPGLRCRWILYHFSYQGSPNLNKSWEKIRQISSCPNIRMKATKWMKAIKKKKWKPLYSSKRIEIMKDKGRPRNGHILEEDITGETGNSFKI